MTPPIKQECSQCGRTSDVVDMSQCPFCHKGQEKWGCGCEWGKPPAHLQFDAHKRMGELHDEIEPPKSESWPKEFWYLAHEWRTAPMPEDIAKSAKDLIEYILKQKQASYEEGKRQGLKEALEAVNRLTKDI